MTHVVCGDSGSNGTRACDIQGFLRLLSTTSSMFPRIRYTPKGQSTGYDYPLNYGNLQCKDRRFAEVVCCSMHYDDL